MKKLVAVPNVTDWEEKFWYSTGGTRAKKIIENPAGGLYYFKLSAEKPPTAAKPGKYFQFEFWSEIIAYKIGKLLGFDVLEYVPAIDGERVGCLCADMIDAGKEELVGGIQYLLGVMPSFYPADNEERSQYTFQLIEEALVASDLPHFMLHIVEVVVFDSIIGNSDRHQENWAIISEVNKEKKALDKFLQTTEALYNDRKTLPRTLANSKLREDIVTARMDAFAARLRLGNKSFSPLFDNGSSLGRELEEARVLILLENPASLEKYVFRGTSAIYWEGKKVSHFELLSQLLDTPYSGHIKATFQRVQNLFDEKLIAQIVESIDEHIPQSHAAFKMPANRKKLIVEMVTLRFQKLQQLCNEGV